MTAIDLNADLGEGCDTDEALLALVSSANIACGWHAGDVNTMRQTTAWALRQGVSIGAHPSFPDRENFGRTEMHLPPEEIYAGVLFQIGGLSAIVRAQGGKLAHVKAHGALYNQASRDRPLATATCVPSVISIRRWWCLAWLAVSWSRPHASWACTPRKRYLPIAGITRTAHSSNAAPPVP